MTGLLASVKNLVEAEIVLSARVDIVDLKNPETGALGRLATEEISNIVSFVDGACPVSATIGDLPMHAQLIFDAVQEIAGTGVDFVKIGLATDELALPVLDKISMLTLQAKLVAVLFADQQPDFRFILALKEAGFAGVMLDTFDKAKGSLCQIMDQAKLKVFVNQARDEKLLCGLAGSLTLSDIALLLPLKPDYLGFRSALCKRHTRTCGISKANVQVIKQVISSHH